MEIVDVTAEHRESATGLLSRFFAEEGFDVPAGDLARHFDEMLADPSCWAALALEDGKAAGVVTVTTMLYAEWGRLGEIGDLYVVPHRRGRRIGASLVATAVEWCRGRGCSALSTVVTPGGNLRHGLSRFYERLKFEPSGRTLLYRRL